jgi:hypothetical protein
VIVAVAEADAPSLSVALKVTIVEPFGKEIVAVKPVATSEPSTSH